MLLLFRIANTWKYCNRPKISIKLSKAIFLHLSNEVRQKRTDCFSMLVCYGVAVSDCEIHEKRKKWVCQHDPDLMRDLIDLRKFKPLRYCWGVNIDGIKSKQLFRLNGLVCVAYWSSWKRGYFCCQTKIFPSFFLKKKKVKKRYFFQKSNFCSIHFIILNFVKEMLRPQFVAMCRKVGLADARPIDSFFLLRSRANAIKFGRTMQNGWRAQQSTIIWKYFMVF